LSKLPKAEKAVIEEIKLTNYILSPVHPIGRFKAAFFRKLGYTIANREAFEQQLRKIANSGNVSTAEEIQYGKKYVIEGNIESPSGENVKVVTVWVILKGEDVPRFVTVYPEG
jgi:hypothetical protein